MLRQRFTQRRAQKAPLSRVLDVVSRMNPAQLLLIAGNPRDRVNPRAGAGDCARTRRRDVNADAKSGFTTCWRVHPLLARLPTRGIGTHLMYGHVSGPRGPLFRSVTMSCVRSPRFLQRERHARTIMWAVRDLLLYGSAERDQGTWWIYPRRPKPCARSATRMTRAAMNSTRYDDVTKPAGRTAENPMTVWQARVAGAAKTTRTPAGRREPGRRRQPPTLPAWIVCQGTSRSERIERLVLNDRIIRRFEINAGPRRLL